MSTELLAEFWVLLPLSPCDEVSSDSKRGRERADEGRRLKGEDIFIWSNSDNGEPGSLIVIGDTRDNPFIEFTVALRAPGKTFLIIVQNCPVYSCANRTMFTMLLSVVGAFELVPSW